MVSEVKMIIVVRRDLDLGKGKMAAQVAHAAVSLALHSMKKDKRIFRQWLDQGQKKVVVRVDDLKGLYELKDGVPAARKMMKKLKICASAPSLGGIESLITLPIDTTHASLTPAERAKMGIPEGLIRLSVGIEDSEDLVEDFQKALA